MHTVVSGAVLQHLQWLSVQLSGEDNLPVGLRQPARDLEVFPGSGPAKPWTDGTAIVPCVSGEAGRGLCGYDCTTTYFAMLLSHVTIKGIVLMLAAFPVMVPAGFKIPNMVMEGLPY